MTADAPSLMRHLADTFAGVHTRRGCPFDFSLESVVPLDSYLAKAALAPVPPEVERSLVGSAGAYLGEILVRADRARWIWNSPLGGGPPVLELGPDWETQMMPVDKVGTRLRFGFEHTLVAFMMLAWSRDLAALPPWIRVTISPLPGE